MSKGESGRDGKEKAIVLQYLFYEGEPIFVRKSKVFLFQKWSKIKQ